MQETSAHASARPAPTTLNSEIPVGERSKRPQPYIPDSAQLRELTVVPLIVGTVLGIVFGASSLYLVLKVGLTVSASIPVAVLSITFFRLLSKVGLRNATILENNVVQTAGSAGESIAFGVGVTMPAIMILGFDLEVTRVTLVALLGGLLGILMMIPLRRALIVEQHAELKYPEGTACAEVLKAGADEESRAAAGLSAGDAAHAAGGGKTIFFGFGVGLAYKAVMVALRGWKDIPEKIFSSSLKGGSVAAEISPELLGVGYIIGPRVASIMASGGILAYLVFIPAIKFFGEGMAGPLAPGTVPIHDMAPNQIRSAYILYIGAGSVAAGGIISLVRSLPTIWHGIQGGLRDFRGGSRQGAGPEVPRTERDLSMKTVLIGSLVLVIAITLAPPLQMNLVGAILIVVFGFLFVTVSSRLTGEIGSSSNPISGMTVATLLLTCGVFLVMGWTAPPYYVTALSVGAIVCIAASNGGSTSQDLKTGFLVGATPRAQQIAILIGALASALVLGPILLRLNSVGTVYVPQAAVERRVDDAADTAEQRPTEAFKATLRTDPGKLEDREQLEGPQAKDDAKSYLVWHKTDDVDGPPGKYLVDDSGSAVYLVDPGVNGTHSVRPDGTRVAKFDAPKATLMSYIIKGILNGQLPWSLVLLGVMTSVVLELSGVPSLPFAVGVYLPLSSSLPIYIGGLVRWLADARIHKRFAGKRLTAEQLEAEGNKSPGVLLSSGYIAGGAIAGIVIAFVAGVMGELQGKIDEWAKANNPMFEGPNADLLSVIPFVGLAALLYFIAIRFEKPAVRAT
jgi:putative OPT family oligopeptide transporter